MGVHESIIGEVWRSAEMFKDLDALCSFGGRFCGMESEAKALQYLRGRLADIPGIRVTEHDYEYDGWRRVRSQITLLGPETRVRPAHSLMWSPNTPKDGLTAEVVDIGRGTFESFEANAARIPGRVVLVRHEHPFCTETIHRMKKYMWARERGATGFLIANNIEGEMVVTGFAADNTPKDIPALGISLETGAAIAAMGSAAKVRMEIEAERGPAKAVNLIAEAPGRGTEWVVLGAHYDGHDLGQSALDNATGAAAALEILRRVRPHAANLPRGLRVMLFTTEEWGLHGSRVCAARDRAVHPARHHRGQPEHRLPFQRVRRAGRTGGARERVPGHADQGGASDQAQFRSLQLRAARHPGLASGRRFRRTGGRRPAPSDGLRHARQGQRGRVQERRLRRGRVRLACPHAHRHHRAPQDRCRDEAAPQGPRIDS